MKRFALLKLFPVGWGSGNEVLSEHECANEQDAIEHFRKEFFAIPLDDSGYAKIGPNTFCIAQFIY